MISGALEILEGRIVLSTVAVNPGSARVVSVATHRAAPTTTTLAVRPGTLGQPITFSASVRGPASAGSPRGTVAIADHGQVLATINLTPAPSAGRSKFATSTATITLASQPGGDSYFYGPHAVTATFTPSGPFAKSVATKAFTVTPPAYVALAGGVRVATIAPGSGPAIQSGQTAHVLYTGYLSTGQVFDQSKAHGGKPFAFTLGAGQVVPGFEAGAAGMRAGETRIVEIPPDQGYGATANGAIPANSTLIFVLTLASIS